VELAKLQEAGTGQKVRTHRAQILNSTPQLEIALQRGLKANRASKIVKGNCMQLR
jgi:hypothetical protein